MKLRLIILLACTQVVLFGQTRRDTALSFRPHSVGDFWVYAHVATYMSSGHMYYKRVDVLNRVIKPNGIEYAPFITTNLSTGSRDTMYLRVDSTTAVVWGYNSFSGLEAFGDSLLSERHEWSLRTVKGSALLTRTMSDPYSIQRWASGLGLYYSWWDEFGFPYADTLVYANVGGILYGTVLHVEKPNLTPNEFTVSDPFPNPFNPRTSIRLSLKKTDRLSIVVYDQLGRFVESVADRVFESGETVLIWDAGQQSSGVYYIRVASNGRERTLPVLLVK